MDKAVVDVLIAKYLKKHNYTDTLKCFLKDCDGSIDDILEGISWMTINNQGQQNCEKDIEKDVDEEDLETIVYERMRFNASVNNDTVISTGSEIQTKENQDGDFDGKLGKNVFCKNYDKPDFSIPVDAALRYELGKNQFVVQMFKWRCLGEEVEYIVCSTSARKVYVLRMIKGDGNTNSSTSTRGGDGRYVLVSTHQFKSIIKFIGEFDNTHMYMCGIDGQFYVFDRSGLLDGNLESSQSQKTQMKLDTRVVAHIDTFKTQEGKCNVVVCGMDKHIYVYQYDFASGESGLLGKTRSPMLSTITNIKLLEYTHGSVNGKWCLFVSMVDNTQVHIYELPISTGGKEVVLLSKIALNNAQFSTHSFNIASFETFTVSTVSKNNNSEATTNVHKLIVTTSHIPYMRVIVVDLPEKLFIPTAQTVAHYDLVEMNFVTSVEQSNYSKNKIFYNKSHDNFIILANMKIFKLVGTKCIQVLPNNVSAGIYRDKDYIEEEDGEPSSVTCSGKKKIISVEKINCIDLDSGNGNIYVNGVLSDNTTCIYEYR